MSYTREQIEAEAQWCENWVKGADAADMLRQLLAEVDALREDAERWRYARDNCDLRVDNPVWFVSDCGNKINANIWGRHENERAIDAARKKG